MPIELNPQEARVIGCLMEKSVITPDQYPLTLNALTNACNQKSSREPVMNLEPGAVMATIRSLQDKHLVRVEENFRSQVDKFTQRLCNTPFADYQFEPDEFAVMTVLLLRGPRTPGELKANVGRLHSFADNNEVLETLQRLRDREGGAVVTELARAPGRRDSEWMHLLSGEVDAGSVMVARPPQSSTPAPSSAPSPARASSSTSTLEARVEALETEVAALRRQVEELTRR
jgi:uncharacterized protein YceH (UPF0502 family)